MFLLYKLYKYPSSRRNTIAFKIRLCEQQTFQTIHIVIRLVVLGNTNPKPFKVPFKIQLVALDIS